MSGAMFGLFMVATVFNRAKTWHWHRLFELAVLAPFVIMQLLQIQAGLAPWRVVHGYKVGSWVPLLGGFFGAVVATALLRLADMVYRGMQQRQQPMPQQQQQQQQKPGQDEPLSLLLSKAASILLKKLL